MMQEDPKSWASSSMNDDVDARVSDKEVGLGSKFLDPSITPFDLIENASLDSISKTQDGDSSVISERSFSVERVQTSEKKMDSGMIRDLASRLKDVPRGEGDPSVFDSAAKRLIPTEFDQRGAIKSIRQYLKNQAKKGKMREIEESVISTSISNISIQPQRVLTKDEVHRIGMLVKHLPRLEGGSKQFDDAVFDKLPSDVEKKGGLKQVRNFVRSYVKKEKERVGSESGEMSSVGSGIVRVERVIRETPDGDRTIVDVTKKPLNVRGVYGEMVPTNIASVNEEDHPLLDLPIFEPSETGPNDEERKLKINERTIWNDGVSDNQHVVLIDVEAQGQRFTQNILSNVGSNSNIRVILLALSTFWINGMKSFYDHLDNAELCSPALSVSGAVDHLMTIRAYSLAKNIVERKKSVLTIISGSEKRVSCLKAQLTFIFPSLVISDLSLMSDVSLFFDKERLDHVHEAAALHQKYVEFTREKGLKYSHER